jgi:drug/metabolite transporter (DMT)-like permease
MVLGLVAALTAAFLFGIAAAVQAVAVRRTRLVSPLMGLVALCYLLGWGLHLVAISRLPLYVAQVGIAGSLAVTALIAARVVHEPLEGRHWTAIGAIVLGLALLVGAAGPVGHREFGTGSTVALYVAWVAVLVAGLAAARSRGPRTGVLLGLLAGVAYAGSPVATRSLVDPTWDLRTLAPAATITLFGLTGFWLYSLALRRVSVTAATAPLVLLETLVPAVLGVVLFGDRVRDGQWPTAVLGFVVATAGALVLSGAESRLEDVEELPEPLEHVAHHAELAHDVPEGPGAQRPGGVPH